MSRAYYMEFVESRSDLPDRVGGIPTHLPERVPQCAVCGGEMAFLAQFYSETARLDLGGPMAVHLYQCAGVDDGCDPQPVVVAVSVDAGLNESALGTRAPGVAEFGIEWLQEEDPPSVPQEPAMTADVLRLYRPKAGGAMPFLDALPPGSICLFQLTQHPAGLNFGGLRAAVYRYEGVMEVALV